MEIVELDYNETQNDTTEKLGKFVRDTFPAARNLNINSTNDFSLRKKSKFSFGIKQGDIVFGKIFGEIDSPSSTLHIDGLIIESSERGSGMGTKLVEAAEKRAIEAGCCMSFVNTTLSTAPGFYEKLGYSLIDEITDYPIKDDEYYFYVKRIN